jgi:hypothetical protein
MSRTNVRRSLLLALLALATVALWYFATRSATHTLPIANQASGSEPSSALPRPAPPADPFERSDTRVPWIDDGNSQKEAVDSTEGLMLLVENERREAIPGAWVRRFEGPHVPEGLATIGHSNARGEVIIVDGEAPPRWILVTHGDYAERRLCLPESPTGPIVVTLQPAVAIRGFLTNWSPALADRGVEVIAHPRSSPWAALENWRTRSTASTSPSSSPSVYRSATVDQTGTFQVAGCEPGVVYTLGVVGHGLIGANTCPEVRAPAVDVPLTAFFIHAGRVRLVGTDGGPPPFDVQQLQSSYELNSPPDGCEHLFHVNDSAKWIDLEGLCGSPLWEPQGMVLAISCEDPEREVLIDVHLDLPGEARGRFPLTLQDVGSNPLPTTTIVRGPDRDRFGSARVWFTAQDGFSRDYPLRGVLYLVDEQERVLEYTVTLAAGEESLEISGLPSGVYRMHMQFDSPAVTHAASQTTVDQVEVAAGARAEWEYRLPPTRSLEIRVRDADGGTYFGPLSIEQEVLPTPGGNSTPRRVKATTEFLRPPYQVHLPEGQEYLVSIPRQRGRVQGPDCSVTESMFETGIVWLDLPELKASP